MIVPGLSKIYYGIHLVLVLHQHDLKGNVHIHVASLRFF